MRWLVLLLIPAVLSLVVTKYPIKNLVKVGDYAIYNLTFFNDEGKEIKVRIYGPYIEEKTFTLEPNKKKSIIIKIKSLASVDYTHYIFVNYDGKEIRVPLKIYALTKGVVPQRTKCHIQFFQNEKDLKFFINCSKNIIQTCIFLDGRVECGKNEITIKNLLPRTYKAEITIYLEDEVVKEDFNIEVLRVTNVFKRVERKDYFFLTKYKIIVENYGNDYYYEILKIKKEGIPIGKVEKRKNVIVIPISVPPGESKSYEVLFITNIIFLLVPIAAAGVFLVYRYLPPVLVSKNYFYYSKDGKTTLHVIIKLKGIKNCEQITVIDKIPKFGRIKKFETIIPEVDGLNLIWRIPRIRRGEIFYLNYTMEFDFEIISGDIELPKLEILFNGRRMKVNARKLEE